MNNNVSNVIQFAFQEEIQKENEHRMRIKEYKALREHEELLQYRMLGDISEIKDKFEELEDYCMLGDCGDVMQLMMNAYNFKFVEREFLDEVIVTRKPLEKFVFISPDEIVCCDNSTGDGYIYCPDSFKEGIEWLNRNKLKGGDTTTEFSKANQVIKFAGVILSANCHSEYFKYSDELAAISSRLEEIRKDIERGG